MLLMSLVRFSFSPARSSIVNKFAKNSSQSTWLENICSNEYENVNITNGSSQKGTSDWTTFRNYLLNISQPCDELLLTCRYALATYRCMDIFDTVLTDEGSPVSGVVGEITEIMRIYHFPNRSLLYFQSG